MRQASFTPFASLSAPSEVVRQFTPNWFAVTMGTGILALTLAQVPIPIPGRLALAEGLWVLAIIPPPQDRNCGLCCVEFRRGRSRRRVEISRSSPIVRPGLCVPLIQSASASAHVRSTVEVSDAEVYRQFAINALGMHPIRNGRQRLRFAHDVGCRLVEPLIAG